MVALMGADERTDQSGRWIVPAARLRSRHSILIFGLHRLQTRPSSHDRERIPRRGDYE